MRRYWTMRNEAGRTMSWYLIFRIFQDQENKPEGDCDLRSWLANNVIEVDNQGRELKEKPSGGEIAAD